MGALDLVGTWPVEHAAAAVVGPEAVLGTTGDTGRPFRIASIAKTLTAWAVLVGVEEGIVALDDAVGQPACTLRHLLAHAGGYPFDGHRPIARPGTRRIYSNTGIELAADAVADAAGMPFGTYLAEAVLEPLGMIATDLRGSPAHAVWSTAADLAAFLGELMMPRLVSPATATEATSVAFPDLAGQLPGIGRFDPCPWGLGFEVRGHKVPHWTGTRNSPATFGHFGGAGTFIWVDPGAGDARDATQAIGCVALTDRSFDEWSSDALRRWPTFSDAVLTEYRGVAG